MKILVTIISSEKHLDSRIKIIQDTWLKDFENYLIISDYDDKENHTVKVTDNKTYESAPEKNLKSFVYLFENCKDFDWFINVDDDSFVNYKNLIELVKTLPTDEIVKIGRLNENSAGFGINYHSGGAGTLFNFKALEVLKNAHPSGKYGYFREENGDYNAKQTPYADVNVGIFCSDNNIEQVNCSLFNPREPKYWNYTNEEIKKQITFHYIFGDEYYKLYNIIHEND